VKRRNWAELLARQWGDTSVVKGSKFGAGGKMRTKVMGAPKGKRPELRLDAAPSNEAGDKQAQMIFIGLSLFSIVLVCGGLFFSIATLIGGINSGHFLWGAIVGGAIGIGVCIFLARALAWMSHFGAIMYAMKVRAWESQERLCQSALKNWRIHPGGAAMAALMLVQSLVGRGQFDEAIEAGQEQWKLHGEDPKFAETLAPMFTSLGMAYQVKGDPKEAIVWTDRGISAMQRSLADLSEKKTWRAKFAGLQGIEWTKQLKMQLSVAYFNNATSYFNQMNYRQAKQAYKQALDACNQAPDFPEKDDIVRVSREQLTRLKHA
jgi:hypothetical protein